MNRIILILLLTFLSLQMKAIYIDGIFYSVSTNGAYVICPPYEGYNYDYFTESGVISIPDSIDNNGTTYPVIAIDYRAFYNCSGLISISLPNTLIAIGGEAFYGCKSLTSITIPYPVTTIGSNAFDYCENLLDVTCLAITPPKMGDYRCLYPAYYMATLHVPERSEEAYKATDWWSCFIDVVGDAEDYNPVSYQKDECDANGDGEVNIADVNKVIDKILSK